jgi:hypothetical protein
MYASPKYNGEPTAQALATGLATLGRYGDDYMVHASEGETIIAPILGNLIMPGLGGIIASALTTKLMGGSWGDALKSGAVSWAGQGLMSGIGGLAEGGGGFFSGMGEGLSAPLAAGSNLFSSGAANPLAQGILGPRGAGLAFSGLKGTDFAQQPVGALPLYEGDARLGYPSRATPGAYNMPTPQAGVGPTAGAGMPSTVAGNALTLRGSSEAAIRAESPLRADAMRASGGMDAATFQASSTPIDQWDTGEVITFQTPEGNMSADRYNIRLAELKGQGTQLQPISRTQKTPAHAVMTKITPTQFDAKMATLRAKGDLAVGEPFYKRPPVEWMDPSTWIRPELKGGELFRDAKHAIESGVPYETALKPSAKYGRGFVVDTPMGTGPKPSVPWYRSKEVLGPVAAAAIPAGLTYALTDDPDGDPEDEVKKLGSTDPRRIAYNKWVLIEDKNSPEALALRDTWYGKPRYSMADLQSKFGATQLGAPRGIAAARGGEVVGRGTGTSDSIPARLSDGEFVMTADAVRNAGNGDRNLGAARMYDMMSRFERMR